MAGLVRLAAPVNPRDCPVSVQLGLAPPCLTLHMDDEDLNAELHVYEETT